MALLSQLVHIPLSGGLDTKHDSKLVMPGKLTDLKNGVFTTHDVIRKRNGYATLARSVLGASDLSAAEALKTYRTELLLLNAGSLYSWSSGIAKWVDKGTVPTPMVEHDAIVRNSAQQTLADMALNKGMALYAWEDTRGGIRATLLDHATGVPFIADVEVSSSGVVPRCLAIGEYLFVVFIDGTNIKQVRIDPESPATLESEVTLRTDVHASTKLLDGVSLGMTENDAAVMAYAQSSGVTVFYLRDTGAVGSSPAGYPNPTTVVETAASSLTVVINTDDSNAIYVAYHNTTDGVRVFSLEQDFSTKFAAVTLDSTTTAMDNITGIAESSSSIRFFYEENAAATYNTLVHVNTISSAGSAGTAAVFMRSVGLGHKAFRQDSVTYVGLVHDSTLQATCFLADSAGFIHAKVRPRVAGGLTAKPSLPQLVNDATDHWVWAQIEKTRFVSEPNEDNANVTYTRTGVGRGAYDFAAIQRYQGDELADNLHLSGAVVTSYDGRTLAEHGFHIFPENVSLGQTASGGSLSDGTYGVAVIYQWVDNRGQVHRSAPWIGSITVNGGGSSQEINVTIPTLRVTDKSNVTIEVYRTEDAGTVYYKSTSTSSPVDNDTTVDTVTHDSQTSDANIISNEVLYTVGGVVENIAAPPATAVTASKGRLWAINAEDRNELWYSKRISAGYGVEFSDVFTLRVDPEGGDCVAIAEMDDKTVVFKADNIYVVFGDGPNASGQGAAFSEPQLVSADVGCKDPRSVVLTSDGLMFQSDKGIYLLDRGLRAHYIGEEVQDYNDQEITSAVLIDDDNQVRFTTSASRCLVYDYSVRQWSTFTAHEAVGAVVWGDTYHFLKSNAQVRYETPGVYQDEGNAYELELVTAWIKMAGLQGFQRVRRLYLLGEYLAAHKLKVQVAYDYQEFYEKSLQWDAEGTIDAAVFGDDATFGASSVFGGVADGVYQMRAHLPRQKCQAIRFKIADTDAQAESYSLASLALEVGVKKGGYKLRAGKTVQAS